MPKIEIDGISVDVETNSTIIEVADRLAIPIPRFCYHNKLSVAANCRMCLVHVEKAPKALPACATPVADGMKIWTKSKEAVAAQRSVMEFLLINHPLDCPICDQGGECELQDVSLEYGRSDSRYTESKRAVLDHNLGPLIATELTRCIQCTRCVRFGEEISGERELGATGRGETMEIGTFIAQTVNSEVSGNIIDLCPVGALTSKPYRFTARAWELKQMPTISPHDCIGSNLYLHTMQQKVMRVAPKNAENLNEVWLSDRDRFSYEGLLHTDRLRKPLLRKQRAWHTVSWDEAIEYASAGIKLTIETYGADKLGVLASPNLSTEEYYLLQKLTRSLGSNNIDHRLRQLDFKSQSSAPSYPNLGINFAELANQNAALLIGTNIAKEQPLASIRLRNMVKNGGKIAVINPVDYSFNFTVEQKSIVPAENILRTLAAVAKELINITSYPVSADTTAALMDIDVDLATKQIATLLMFGKNKQIIIGQLAQMHPKAGEIFAIGNLIADIIGGQCGCFSDGANAAGAWLAGCVPHRLPNAKPIENIGKNAYEMLKTPLNGYILFGFEPEFDSILGSVAIDTIKQADFVIAVSAYQNESLLEIADVILPLSIFAECHGSMININGNIQKYSKAVAAYGDSRPGWNILCMLGSVIGLPDFKFNALDEVSNEVESSINIGKKFPKWQQQPITKINSMASANLLRVAPIALYAVDGLVRRAKSLQATLDAHLDAKIIVNSNTGKKLKIITGEIVSVSAAYAGATAMELSVLIDDTIADYTAVVYQANQKTIALGLPYAVLEVRKC